MKRLRGVALTMGADQGFSIDVSVLQGQPDADDARVSGF